MPLRGTLPRLVVAASLVALLLPGAVNEIAWSHRDQTHGFAGDFFHSTWHPGQKVLRGENPYPSPDSESLASAETIYPPTLFVAALPLTFPSFGVSRVLWTVVLSLAAMFTLVVLGGRDPRCYAVWLVSAPVVGDLMWGNVTLLLVFAAALVWRLRDRPYGLGLVLGAAIAVKLLLAPLIAWLLFTRRFLAAGVAVASSALIVTLAWAAISFRGLLDYPQLLRRTTELQLDRGLLLTALVRQHDLGVNPSLAVGLAAAAAFLSVAWFLRNHDDRSYALSLVAVLYATPIIHVFNLGLLVVAIAVVYRRFSWVWMVLPLLWLAAFSGPFYEEGRYDLIAFSILLTGATAAWLALRPFFAPKPEETTNQSAR